MGIILILMAWFIQMPLWLSIVLTVYGGFEILYRVAKIGYDSRD